MARCCQAIFFIDFALIKLYRFSVKIKGVTSFEIQAILFNKLQGVLLNTNYILRGEVKFNRCRFDLAIFSKNYESLLVIIEVKNYKRKTTPNIQSKQHKKYSRLCKNVIYCLNLQGINSAVSQVKNALRLKGGLGG
jgi:hypothetical protein